MTRANQLEQPLGIRSLGAFEVIVDGMPVPEDAWARRKTKDVLKLLLTEPGTAFTVDQIVEALFPNADPARAGSNVQARVSELRRALEPDLKRGSDSRYVRHVGEGYVLSMGPELWIDTVAFDARIAEAHTIADREEWTDAIGAFDEALTLYRGEFLAEDRYADWAEGVRSHFRNSRIEALSRQAACYEKLGRLRQAISCCQLILEIEPHRESIIRQLMGYQDTAGHRAQALDTYSEGERALNENLSVEPSSETRALFERIRDRKSASATLDPRRIAVLPFANYSPDPEDDYFADGMTEELIGSLAKVRDFRVIARTSVTRFKGATEPVSEIAKALSVGSILEGSVRKAGDRVRISAQLIDARTEEHLWADEYEGELRDTFAIQKNAAREVARALEI